MHGVKRVMVFCTMIAILPTILIILPLYLRHNAFANTKHLVAESDIIKITEGMSSIFCQRHVLQMNATFNAFQINQMPEISRKRKHIRLKKSMSLPDDTLEYWGFFLLRGATVKLKVCSRYQGSRILVVKGEKNLKTCGLMNHNLKKFGAHMDQDYRQVKVTYETVAQEITDSKSAQRTERSDNDAVSDENVGAEDVGDIKTEPSVEALEKSAQEFIARRMNRNKKTTVRTESTAVKTADIIVDDSNITEPVTESYSREDNATFDYSVNKNATSNVNGSGNTESTTHRKRHTRKKFTEYQTKLYKLHNELHSNEDIDLRVKRIRRKRSDLTQIYDGGIEHGGNAFNFTNSRSDDSSVSSFETGLLTCYDGQILLTRSFSPSHLCKDIQYLDVNENFTLPGNDNTHMETVHDIVTDGYYYYIFYSDNDIVRNEIHAIFDIYKPTFQYTNITGDKSCVNKTECSFPISMFSDESVIVEVMTRDGIEHEEDDITLLVSICEPRTSVYILFPIAVMFLILGCAFL